MNILVVDPDHPNQEHRRDWTSLLGEQVQPLSAFPQDVVLPSIVFIHAQFANLEISAFSKKNSASVCVVISGGAKPVEWSDSAHCYWRTAPVAKPADSSFAQCARAFLANLQSTEVPHFALLEPQSKEDTLTLRLLCEAWQIVNHLGNSEYNGIPIQAPGTIAEWLAPFGTAATADGVAALMGEAKGAAANLLNAVERPKEKNVEDAVSAYLAAVASKQ